MRRTLVFGVVLALLLISLAMPAALARSPQGELNAAFNAWLTGGFGSSYAVDAHGGMGGINNAPNAILIDDDAVRIAPGFFDQEYCSSSVFGTWAFFFWDDPAILAELQFEIWLDGEPLNEKATPVKHVVDPAGFYLDGEPLWWRSIGVPVIGTLEPGVHTVSSQTVFPDGEVEDYTATVTITDCEED